MKSISAVRNSITRTVVISFIIVFFLSLLSMYVVHARLEAQTKKYNLRQIKSVFKLYQVILSEKIAILASSTDFIDFIRSGSRSREILLPSLYERINSLSTYSIRGFKVNDIVKKKEILRFGDITNLHVTVRLSYFNDQLDNDIGRYGYNLRLYLNKGDLLKGLRQLDANIKVGNAYQVKFFNKERFGNFLIVNSTPLTLDLSYKSDFQPFMSMYFYILFFTLGLFALVTHFRQKKIFNNEIVKPIETIAEKLRNSEVQSGSDYELAEFSYMVDQISTWQKEFNDAKQREKASEIGGLINQILHDIRSPIDIINSLVSHIKNIDEKSRIVLRDSLRNLNDIANGILDIAHDKYSFGKKMTAEPVVSIVSRIVSEKRIQLEGTDIDIVENINKENCFIFIMVEALKFKRAVTNLINNSIDALKNVEKKNKKIEVSVGLVDGLVNIIVRDNGSGIKPELIEKVLSGGRSTKKKGYGVGLSSAKETVEMLNGTLTLNSEVGEGTCITIKIPQSKIPKWFEFRSISIPENGRLIILDDDYGIHYLWKQKLDELFGETKSFKVDEFYSIADLKNFYSNINIAECRFLIDFELVNDKQNGLDIIKELNIAGCSTLVTSRYDDVEVRKRAEQEGVRVLPKTFIKYVDLTLSCSADKKDEADSGSEADKSLFVLLDDNRSVTDTWELIASMSEIDLVTYNSYDSFKNDIEAISRKASVYVDSNLGIEVKGEEVLKDLYELGFRDLYLATGTPAEDFNDMYWIKKIVGKEPPF